jgi:hypothetical protein
MRTFTTIFSYLPLLQLLSGYCPAAAQNRVDMVLRVYLTPKQCASCEEKVLSFIRWHPQKKCTMRVRVIAERERESRALMMKIRVYAPSVRFLQAAAAGIVEPYWNTLTRGGKILCEGSPLSRETLEKISRISE